MYILRSVRESDFDDLFRLSNFVSFINLPADEEIIKAKITNSIKSFENPSADFFSNYYLFALEDQENNEVIGVSMIHAQHGHESRPHFYLKIGKEHKFSNTTNTGFIHRTLKLGYDTDGPSEIGGLVLHPERRASKEKLGKQLSFVRFLYMGLFPERFKSEIHTELMPPLDKDGNSPLWEAIGRRFLNMNYQEADILSRSNKEFILSLYPSDTIYETLLPPSAREAIGKIGDDTKPVKGMLEKIGFKYTEEVDPFDGGPHYRANLVDILPIKNKFSGTVNSIDKNSKGSAEAVNLLLKLQLPNTAFAAVKVNGFISGSDSDIMINVINDQNYADINLESGNITDGIFL